MVARVLPGRLEAFCQGMVRGMSQTAAAVAAGWAESSAHAAGSRAAQREDVKARILEIREDQAAATSEAMRLVEMPTRELVLRDLVEIAARAKTGGHMQVQLRAIEMLGKELGMFVQRSQVVVESPLNRLTPEQLLALAAALDQPETLEHEPGVDLEAVDADQSWL